MEILTFRLRGEKSNRENKAQQLQGAWRILRGASWDRVPIILWRGHVRRCFVALDLVLWLASAST